ncbi:acetyl-CoA carboxylase biotin carboxyl carrier protein [soil metagenome]
MPEQSERGEAGELLALIDRFEALLERSDLIELEVEAGTTMLRLAKPATLVPAAQQAIPVTETLPARGAADGTSAGGSRDSAAEPAGRFHAVVAPLTGIFYTSPSPGAAPYVKEGAHVSAGQVIGLIEAMKLFNEIKSDITGTVRRMAAESGALVKQKQTLIEVEPS